MSSDLAVAAASAVRVRTTPEREGEADMHLLKYRVPKLWLTARHNRQQIIEAGLNRRELFKMGLLTSGGYLVAKSGLSAWASGGCDAGECQRRCSIHSWARVRLWRLHGGLAGDRSGSSSAPTTSSWHAGASKEFTHE